MTRSLPKDVVNLHAELGQLTSTLGCQLVLHNFQSITERASLQLQACPGQAIARRGEVSSRDVPPLLISSFYLYSLPSQAASLISLLWVQPPPGMRTAPCLTKVSRQIITLSCSPLLVSSRVHLTGPCFPNHRAAQHSCSCLQYVLC